MRIELGDRMKNPVTGRSGTVIGISRTLIGDAKTMVMIRTSSDRRVPRIEIFRAS